MSIWPDEILENAALCFGDPEIAPEFEKATTGQQFTALFFGGNVERQRQYENDFFFGKRKSITSSMFFHLPEPGDVIRELGGEIK